MASQHALEPLFSEKEEFGLEIYKVLNGNLFKDHNIAKNHSRFTCIVRGCEFQFEIYQKNYSLVTQIQPFQHSHDLKEDERTLRKAYILLKYLQKRRPLHFESDVLPKFKNHEISEGSLNLMKKICENPAEHAKGPLGNVIFYYYKKHGSDFN